MKPNRNPMIQFKPRYVAHDVNCTHVLAYDNKTGKEVLFTKFEWEAKKGFLMMVINGEIVP
jgi:hypothetical protein